MPIISTSWRSSAAGAGPQNWEWVQAILKDTRPECRGAGQPRCPGGVPPRRLPLCEARSGQGALVDRYGRPGADPDEPTVVIGHSLGSVVAYSLLSTRRDAQVPPPMTIVAKPARNPGRARPVPPDRRTASGCRLDQRLRQARRGGAGAARPTELQRRTAVDHKHTDDLRNQTENRHGIVGYLDKPQIAGPLLEALPA